MFARNGGKTIRVLKANGPGQLSVSMALFVSLLPLALS